MYNFYLLIDISWYTIKKGEHFVMTFDNLMKTTLMKNAVIIAGKDGIYNEVTWCAPVDSINFSNWLMPGLVCLDTGEMTFEETEQFHNNILKHSIAAVLLFYIKDVETLQKQDLSFYDKNRIPLTVLNQSTTISGFCKRFAGAMNSLYNNEMRLTEWVHDLCMSSNRLNDETLLEILGYPSGYYYRCIIFTIREKTDDSMIALDIDLNRAKALLTEVFAPKGALLLHIIERRSLIVFGAFPRKEPSGLQSRQRIINAANFLTAAISDRKWEISAGCNASGPNEFSESFFTASQAATMISILHIKEKICFYEDWYMHITLLKEPRQTLRMQMENLLYPILDNEEYIETLADYLTFGENLKLTAEHLHLHTNSLKYRLGKIQETLGCDLQDVNIRLRLRIALTIYKYLKNSADEAPNRIPWGQGREPF